MSHELHIIRTVMSLQVDQRQDENGDGDRNGYARADRSASSERAQKPRGAEERNGEAQPNRGTDCQFPSAAPFCGLPRKMESEEQDGGVKRGERAQGGGTGDTFAENDLPPGDRQRGKKISGSSGALARNGHPAERCGQQRAKHQRQLRARHKALSGLVYERRIVNLRPANTSLREGCQIASSAEEQQCNNRRSKEPPILGEQRVHDAQI